MGVECTTEVCVSFVRDRLFWGGRPDVQLLKLYVFLYVFYSFSRGFFFCFPSRLGDFVTHHTNSYVSVRLLLWEIATLYSVCWLLSNLFVESRPMRQL
jgi:hypothetical protein